MSERFRLYHRTFKDRAGQSRQTDNYYVDFRDHRNVRQRWPLDGSKSTCEDACGKLIKLVDCRQRGDVPHEDIIRWLDTISDDLRGRIAKADIIDPEHISRNDVLLNHLEGRKDADGNLVMPGYRQYLEDSGGTPGHITQTIARVRRILDGCGFTVWKELSRPAVPTRIRGFLATLRKAGKRPLGVKTCNYYLRELKGFAAWMKGDKRVTYNPLEDLDGFQHEDGESKDRQAFSVTEMLWLLDTTAKTKAERFGMTAEERVILYDFAYESGIRPGQIRKLVTKNFRIDDEDVAPVVVTEAKYVKRRKRHEQALDPDLVEVLRPLLAKKMPDALVFGTMPDKFTLGEMIRADMADARAAWIEAASDQPKELEKRQRSDFLTPVSHDGLRRDFYSIRHTHGHTLGDQGLSQKDIAASLHHTRTATTDRYTKATREARQRTVKSLPEVFPMRLRATGTDGPIDPCAKTDPSRRNSADIGGTSTNENPRSGEGNGDHQRGRRDSNPQPPDRQSGTLTN